MNININMNIVYQFVKNVLKIVTLSIVSHTVIAKTPLVEVRIKDHLFFPSEVIVPVDTKVKLLVINDDTTAEEFESYELNREKIIMGNRKSIIFIGPLKAGKYPFFGEFYPKTAQGVIIAQ